MKNNEQIRLLDAAYPNVLQCTSFEKECMKEFAKSKSKRLSYKKWLLKKIEILTTRSEKELQETETFEFLSHGKGFKLYSLRRPEYEGNPRILFSVVMGESGVLYIMLLMFKELHDGDYRRMIPVATRRMETILKLANGG